jgi:predicted nucleic acid-binding protein
MRILVDSSVWVDYFREGEKSSDLDIYIDHNIICTNDLILSELIPFLKLQNQSNLIKLLQSVNNVKLKINWKSIQDYQLVCIKKGINKIGIPDLIILDNLIQNDLTLYTFDKHFKLINKYIGFKLLSY